MAKRHVKVPEVSTLSSSFSMPYYCLPGTAMVRLFRASATATTAGISRTSLVKIEPEATHVKNSDWVDFMRSSSPTRAVMPCQQICKPSAIDRFDKIANAARGKKIVLFLDYDGTLSPIVQDPERAFMTRQMRDAVRDAANYFPTAIVSGRSREKVYSFVKLSQLYYAGSHGMDIKGPSNRNKDTKKVNQQVIFQPASDFLPMIDEVYKALVRKTKPIEGAKVESNKFCLSVHYRCVDEKMWGVLAEQVRLVLNEYPQLKLTQGRKVLEIRPTIKWDKGKALEFLLESLGFGNSNDVFPIYIGDDRTDEDAFKVLLDRRQGTGIIVTKLPKETCASYSVQDPTEVMNFLLRLVKWKRLSPGTLLRT